VCAGSSGASSALPGEVEERGVRALVLGYTVLADCPRKEHPLSRYAGVFLSRVFPIIATSHTHTAPLPRASPLEPITLGSLAAHPPSDIPESLLSMLCAARCAVAAAAWAVPRYRLQSFGPDPTPSTPLKTPQLVEASSIHSSVPSLLALSRGSLTVPTPSSSAHVSRSDLILTPPVAEHSSSRDTPTREAVPHPKRAKLMLPPAISEGGAPTPVLTTIDAGANKARTPTRSEPTGWSVCRTAQQCFAAATVETCIGAKGSALAAELVLRTLDRLAKENVPPEDHHSAPVAALRERPDTGASFALDSLLLQDPVAQRTVHSRDGLYRLSVTSQTVQGCVLESIVGTEPTLRRPRLRLPPKTSTRRLISAAANLVRDADPQADVWPASHATDTPPLTELCNKAAASTTAPVRVLSLPLAGTDAWLLRCRPVILPPELRVPLHAEEPNILAPTAVKAVSGKAWDLRKNAVLL
jgi:hypothetical protein